MNIRQGIALSAGLVMTCSLFIHIIRNIQTRGTVTFNNSAVQKNQSDFVDC